MSKPVTTVRLGLVVDIEIEHKAGILADFFQHYNMGIKVVRTEND